MTLGEVLGDIRMLAQAIDAQDAGDDLIAGLLPPASTRVRLAVRGAAPSASPRSSGSTPSSSPGTGCRS